MGSRSLAGLPLGFERTQLGLLLGEQLLDHFALRGIVFRGEEPPVVLDIEASDILWGIQVPLPCRGPSSPSKAKASCGLGEWQADWLSRLAYRYIEARLSPDRGGCT